MTGQAELVLVGGTESMSEAPTLLRGTRFGVPLGKTPVLEDSLWSSLTDTHAGLPMALTAEKLAEQYRISQDEVDEYAVLSQRRFAAAQEAGRFQDEIAPMEIPGKKADADGGLRLPAHRFGLLQDDLARRAGRPGALSDATGG